MFGDDVRKEIMKIPRSDDTIKKRILDISDDIEKKIITKLSKQYFALQISESTNISVIVYLIGFVHFIN